MLTAEDSSSARQNPDGGRELAIDFVLSVFGTCQCLLRIRGGHEQEKQLHILLAIMVTLVVAVYEVRPAGMQLLCMVRAASAARRNSEHHSRCSRGSSCGQPLIAATASSLQAVHVQCSCFARDRTSWAMLSCDRKPSRGVNDTNAVCDPQHRLGAMLLLQNLVHHHHRQPTAAECCKAHHCYAASAVTCCAPACSGHPPAGLRTALLLHAPTLRVPAAVHQFVLGSECAVCSADIYALDYMDSKDLSALLLHPLR